MINNDNLLIVTILEKFGLGKNIQITSIEHIQKFKSDSYALGDVWSFDYQGRHYYISNDYSLDNNPKYIRNVFEDVNRLLKGQLINNPLSKSSNLYSMGVGSNEYYLWQSE